MQERMKKRKDDKIQMLQDDKEGRASFGHVMAASLRPVLSLCPLPSDCFAPCLLSPEYLNQFTDLHFCSFYAIVASSFLSPNYISS